MIPPNATDSRHSVTITTDGNRQAEAGHSNSLRRRDVFKSPLSDFTKSVAAAGLENCVHYLMRGDADNFQWRGEDAVMNAPPG